MIAKFFAQILLPAVLITPTFADESLLRENRDLSMKIKILNEKLLNAEKRIYELENQSIDIAKKHDEQLTFIINQYNDKIKLLEEELPSRNRPENPPNPETQANNNREIKTTQKGGDRSNQVISTNEKLDSITIPSIQFIESPLTEVIEEIQRVSRNFDKSEINPSRKGVNLWVKTNPLIPLPKITVSLGNMILRDLLDFLVENIGWSYAVRDNVIVIEPMESKVKETAITTEFFKISPMTLSRLGKLVYGKEDDKNGTIPQDFEMLFSNAFSKSGIYFNQDEGCFLTFDSGKSELRITHQEQTINSIKEILGKIARPQEF